MEKPTRLFDFIYYQKGKYPQAKAFNSRVEGEWVSFSTDEMIDLANQVSAGLLAMGVEKGDKIALATYRNRTEWVAMDIGMSQIGVINVPVYPTISPLEYEYIFNEAEVKYAFVGGGDLYEKVIAASEKTPSLIQVYTFEEVVGRPFWKDIFRPAEIDKVKAISDSIEVDELATIIYTSGTTGKPKGVMLSHRNIASNANSIIEYLPIGEGDRVLSFLPICHIFERTACYVFTLKGGNLYFAGTDNLGGEEGDIRAVKPHHFNAVPRLLEKVYEKIIAKGNELSGIKHKLFFWALSLTDDYDYDKEYSGMEKIKRNIADKLIFSKWREALGGEVRSVVSGAAPLPAMIARVFSAAGVPIREGYGLTETSPGLAIGEFKPGGAKIGYIGPAIPDVELMIDTSEGEYREGEGEILARGPNIMLGYYKKPEATADVFKEIDGVRWFKTGDIGRLADVGKGKPFLQITDRKKELFKTSGGKYVAPAPIESAFKEDFLVEQIMLVGDKRKFVSALIIPSVDALKSWCMKKGVVWTDLDSMIKNQKIIRKYQSIADKINPSFGHVEQVKKFTIVNQHWLPSRSDGTDAELTPTMKLKRRVILEKNKDLIDQMYED